MSTIKFLKIKKKHRIKHRQDIQPAGQACRADWTKVFFTAVQEQSQYRRPLLRTKDTGGIKSWQFFDVIVFRIVGCRSVGRIFADRVKHTSDRLDVSTRPPTVGMMNVVDPLYLPTKRRDASERRGQPSKQSHKARFGRQAAPRSFLSHVTSIIGLSPSGARSACQSPTMWWLTLCFNFASCTNGRPEIVIRADLDLGRRL